MAHFYGSLEGSAKTESTRCGTKNSGITGHIRGWTTGVIVDITHKNGEDIVRIYRTGGSNSPYTKELLREWKDGGYIHKG